MLLMTFKPTLLITGVTLAAGMLEMACSMESVPAERLVSSEYEVAGAGSM
jgi:hypothetical protein